MMYNDNGRINKHQQKRFRKLRPAFLNKHGFMVYPSTILTLFEGLKSDCANG